MLQEKEGEEVIKILLLLKGLFLLHLKRKRLPSHRSSRHALGSPGWLVVCLDVTMPKMA